jgi:hypothetical protein
MGVKSLQNLTALYLRAVSLLEFRTFGRLEVLARPYPDVFVAAMSSSNSRS